ncbi:MAG: response regulator [Alphaproteobacteria bacterium]|nr:response regulator [Alphaproteobacteria bacterium]
MEQHYIDAQSELENLAQMIADKPLSWRGWKALRIEISGLHPLQQEDALQWTKSILDSQLQGTARHLYFCPDNNIYCILRNPGNGILEEVGQQISALIYDECRNSLDFMVYDLTNDHLIFAQHVFDHSERLISLKNKEAQNFPATTKQRVLLVEDDVVTRWMVSQSLKNKCDFAVAPTASKAYAMVQSFRPDVVFLDIGLPDENGEKVLEWLKDFNPHTTVIMFSGQHNLTRIAETLSKGADGFISKPFLKEDLLNYLREGQRHVPAE